MGDLVSKNNIDRLERFHSLLAGQYWSALVDIPAEAIVAGDTLLINSLRYVDNNLHTVILRAHPRHYGEWVSVEIVAENGSKSTKDKRLNEHRFLTADFLALFEYQPDHEIIRQSELKGIQDEVADLQMRLTETLQDPSALRELAIKRVEDEEGSKRGGATEDRMLPAVRNAEDVAVTMALGTVQNALSQGISEAQVSLMAKVAEREGKIAGAVANIITSRTGAITRALEKMHPYYAELAAAKLAGTQEGIEQASKIQAGVLTLELFVGKNVTVVDVAEGEPADSSIPLTLCQKKLVVDEEFSAWSDIDEHFDFRSLSAFLKALKDNQGLVEQIFPTERCVLVMVTTRRFIDYGDTWANAENNEKNSIVFLMVRNGQNIKQIYSPVESHLGASRLFPSEDEQQGHFRGFDGTTIKFEDVAYTDRLKAHDLMALHYRRLLIMLFGLDQRLALFGQFYPQHEKANFLNLSFQERYFHFLHDEDGTGLLASPDSQTLDEFISEKNSYIQPGSRLLCNWRELMTPRTAPGAVKEDSGYSVYSFIADPEDNVSAAVVYRQGDTLAVDVAVKRFSTDKMFNCKVNVSAYSPWRSGEAELAYLCLDAVGPEELTRFIQQRKFRSNHLFYIRFFKAAIKFLEQERENELPHRQYLLAAMQDSGMHLPGNIQELIHQCIASWKTGNRGVSLAVGMSTEKGRQALLNQLYRLTQGASEMVSVIQEHVAASGSQLLRAGVNSSGNYVAFIAPKPYECDNRLEAHAWVHRVVYATGKRNIRETGRSWVSMPERSASEITLWEDEEQSRKWYSMTPVFSSWTEKQKLFEMCEKGAGLLKGAMGTPDDEEYGDLLEMWGDAYIACNASGEHVTTPDMFLPVGLIKSRKSLKLIALGTCSTEHWMYARAGDDDSRELLLELYTSWYEYPDKARARLLSMAEKNSGLRFVLIEGKSRKLERFAVKRPEEIVNWHAGDLKEIPTMLNDQWACHMAMVSQNDKVYLTPDLLDDDGLPNFNGVTRQVPGEGYQPVNVYEFESDYFNAVYDADGKKVALCHWYDVTDNSYSAEELIGNMPHNAFKFLQYRLDNIEQAEAFIKYRNRNYQPRENADWPEPPEGVKRYVIRARS
ncbi:hypothetical protein ACRQ68_003520 [Escherichia coli]